MEDVSRLYREGLNLCIGCIYERTASCSDDRLSICNQQYKAKQVGV